MAVQQLWVATPSSGGDTDPLWADVWLRMPLDSSVEQDVSANSFQFLRAIYVDFINDYADSDILAGAAKWGAAGWQCRYDATASAGNVYQVDPVAWAAKSSAAKTWGTKKWTAELWVKIGDNAEPAVSQYRLDLHGSITPSTQKFRIRTREGRVGIDVRSSLTGTFSVGAPTVGYREGTGVSGTNTICWNDSATPIIADNNWHWIAACYDGTYLRLLVDGVVAFQATATVNYDEPWADVVIGGASDAYSGVYTSLATGDIAVDPSATDAIDDVRVTLSAANDRYTSFPVAVPTAAFPVA